MTTQEQTKPVTARSTLLTAVFSGGIAAEGEATAVWNVARFTLDMKMPGRRPHRGGLFERKISWAGDNHMTQCRAWAPGHFAKLHGRGQQHTHGNQDRGIIQGAVGPRPGEY